MKTAFPPGLCYPSPTLHSALTEDHLKPCACHPLPYWLPAVFRIKVQLLQLADRSFRIQLLPSVLTTHPPHVSVSHYSFPKTQCGNQTEFCFSNYIIVVQTSTISLPCVCYYGFQTPPPQFCPFTSFGLIYYLILKQFVCLSPSPG